LLTAFLATFFLATFFLAAVFFAAAFFRDVVTFFRFLLGAFFAGMFLLRPGKEKAGIIHCLTRHGSPIFSSYLASSENPGRPR